MLLRLESPVTSAVRSPAVKSAVERVRDARLPAGRKVPRHAAVIEPAERAGTHAGLDARRGSVGPPTGGRTAAAEPRAAAVEMVAIDERATVRGIGVVVEHDRPATQ